MNKKTLILGGVLVALIVIAFIYQGPLKKWQNNLGKPKNFLAKVDTAKIDKIEMIYGGRSTVLDKIGEKWKYGDSKDFYADPVKLAEALAELKRAATQSIELVSNNKERKSEFKTDESGLKIRLFSAGEKLADFVIGDSYDYYHAFISNEGLPATYSIGSGLAQVFKIAEWRDLAIFSTAESRINKIRFQYPNREFTIELSDGQWQGILPEKFSVNQEKIKKIIQLMSNLKAEAIPEQTFNGTGLEKHLIIIEATGEGVDNVLMVGQNKDDLYYAKRGDSDNIYLISKSNRDELDKWIWQLR